MITLNSNPEDILDELNRYFVKAKYWFAKHVESSQAVKEGNQIIRDMETRCSAFRDACSYRRYRMINPVFYKPKGAMPWLCVGEMKRNGCKYSYETILFAYYETASGEYGSFVPNFYTKIKDGTTLSSSVHFATVITSHCISRWAERTGEPSKGDLRAVLAVREVISEKSLLHSIHNKNGRDSAVVRTSRGVFFGVFRLNDDERRRAVVELRTFLTNEMMSGKQRYMLSMVDRMTDVFDRPVVALSDEDLFSLFFYEEPNTTEEIIGGIVLLRTLCVTAQNVTKQLFSDREERYDVYKNHAMMYYEKELAAEVGETGILSKQAIEKIKQYVQKDIMLFFKIDSKDRDMRCAISRLCDEGIMKVQELGYVEKMVPILRKNAEKWSKKYGEWKDRTSMILNSKHV